MNFNATQIQRFWRGFLTRRRLRRETIVRIIFDLSLRWSRSIYTADGKTDSIIIAFLSGPLAQHASSYGLCTIAGFQLKSCYRGLWTIPFEHPTPMHCTKVLAKCITTFHQLSTYNRVCFSPNIELFRRPHQLHSFLIHSTHLIPFHFSVFHLILFHLEQKSYFDYCLFSPNIV